MNGMWETLFDGMVRGVVRSGNLAVTYPSGRVEKYGDAEGELIELTFHTPQAVRDVFLNAELHAGEAYMDGTITIKDDDVRAFGALLFRNVGDAAPSRLQSMLGRYRDVLRRAAQYNPIGVAQANVAHHYDLSGEMYNLFLDDDKQYSCAYFRKPTDSLELAQLQKKRHIARKLLIKPGMTVLDIGCGWGGMALTLAKEFGAKVVGVTLSTEQHGVAVQRAKDEGLSEMVEFRLQDYRHVTESFDRIVSVGMFEHVGTPHYQEYFRNVKERLKPDGIALIHTIGRVSPPGHTNPWIAKYIFPGGYCPALSETMAAVELEGLYPTDIEMWRLHYAETLRHWFERFTANREKVKEMYDERFCRMWAWYLMTSEMTFRHNKQCVFQIQLANKQESVPLTREYLYEGPDLAEDPKKA